MTATHAKAVELRQMPTEVISVSTLNSIMKDARKRTILRFVRPPDCVVSVEKYLRDLNSGAKTTIVKEIGKFHGVVGRASNAAKASQREAFRDYIALHRSPTGRTANKYHRTHGSAY